jgi:hypothetical protein
MALMDRHGQGARIVRLTATAILCAMLAACSPLTTTSSQPTSPVETATPTTTESPVATATTSAAARGLHWSVLEPAAWPTDVQLRGIVVRADGSFVANASRQQRPLILTSADGRGWTPMPDTTGVLGRGDGSHDIVVNGLTERDGTVVLVGTDMLDDGSAGDARVWRSTDAADWHVVATSAGMKDAEMHGVTVGPAGFVAVGSDGFSGASADHSNSRGATSWISDDGEHWTRAPGQPDVAGSVMDDVLPVDGGYVAWGHLLPNRHRVVPAVWTSPDGLAWHRSTVASWSQDQDGPISAMVAFPGGLVAVGVAADPDHDGAAIPAAWTSVDRGATWRRATVISPDPWAVGMLLSVTFDGSGLFAIGKALMPGGTTERIVSWRSTDEGATWRQLSDDAAVPDALALTVITVPGAYAAFGFTHDQDSLVDPYLEWIAER